MSSTPLMKNGLGKPAILRISQSISRAYPKFDCQGFEKSALKGLTPLELKERVNHLIGVLHEYLPDDFSSTSEILLALPPVWDRGDPDDSIRGFAIWPVTDYVAVYGLDQPELSLEVLKALTPLFSAEFAIRPFIERYPEICKAYFDQWIRDSDEHVRRLVSEGTRPRLPWGIQLKQFILDPAPVMPNLEKLRLDESEYVRRSVANNLNDISKDHPEFLLKHLKKWQKKDGGKSAWLIKHALRSLVKQGHPEVFPLLGYTENPDIKIKRFSLDKKIVNFGDTLELSLALSPSILTPESLPQKIVVDFAIHYVKANGQHAPKVYKWKNIQFENNEDIVLEKRQAFKAITTRKFYGGKHFVAVHINGVEVARKKFELMM